MVKLEGEYVAQCTCTHEDRDCGRVIKHFRFLPLEGECPAHGARTM